MKTVTVSLADAEDGTMGVCLHCGEVQDGCEPDARQYECDCCGRFEVYGIAEAIIMGAADLSDE